MADTSQAQGYDYTLFRWWCCRQGSHAVNEASWSGNIESMDDRCEVPSSEGTRGSYGLRSVTTLHHGEQPLLLALLVDQRLVDVRNHTTTSNGRLDESVQLRRVGREGGGGVQGGEGGWVSTVKASLGEVIGKPGTRAPQLQENN